MWINIDTIAITTPIIVATTPIIGITEQTASHQSGDGSLIDNNDGSAII